jgi:hypothetical protein
MDNGQKANNCINIPSSLTFRPYLVYLLIRALQQNIEGRSARTGLLWPALYALIHSFNPSTITENGNDPEIYSF